MKIIQYAAIAGLTAAFVCLNPLMAEAGDKSKTQQKNKTTASQLRTSVKNYIQKEKKLKGGYFLQFDKKENKTWKLISENIQRTVRKLKGNNYVVGVEFKTEDYNPSVLEIDFLMKQSGGSFTPFKIKIRTVNGVPRFKYRKKSKNNSAYSHLDLAPDFTLLDLKGKKVRLSDFEGKVVILNFWATWCPPCRAEIPDFVELYSAYKNRGFQMIGISIDPDGIKAIDRFMEKLKITYPVLIGNMKVTSVYGGITSIPTSFVITQDGHIYKKYVGYRSKDIFEKDIKVLLKN